MVQLDASAVTILRLKMEQLEVPMILIFLFRKDHFRMRFFYLASTKLKLSVHKRELVITETFYGNFCGARV